MNHALARGTLWLLFSELAFILSNYLIHVVLARYLGPADYGLFGVIISLYLINRAFLNVGIPRAISKFIPETPSKKKDIFQSALALQVLLAISFASLYIFFSRPISSLLQDASLQDYLVFLGIAVVPLSFYSLNTSGFLNGLHLFMFQALVKTLFPLLRTLLTILLVFLGFGLWGALWGYQLALIFGLVLAWFFLRRQHDIPHFLARELFLTILFIIAFLGYYYFHNLLIMGVMLGLGLLSFVYLQTRTTYPEKAILYKRIISFSIPVTIASLALILLRNINILFIKALIVDNEQVGLYTAAYTISTIPYIIFSAVPLALTPSVSRAAAEYNHLLIQKYIAQSLRYLLLLLVPITVLIAASSKPFLTLFYSSAYSEAASVLSVLILGSAFLSVFATLAAVSTGSGKPKVEMILSIVFLGALGLLSWQWIPRFGMRGSAYAVLLTSFLAAVAIAAYIYHRYGGLLSWLSLLRIMGVGGIIYFLTRLWPASGIMLLVQYALLGTLFYLLLYLWGEIRREDWILLRKVYKRGANESKDSSE